MRRERLTSPLFCGKYRRSSARCSRRAAYRRGGGRWGRSNHRCSTLFPQLLRFLCFREMVERLLQPEYLQIIVYQFVSIKTVEKWLRGFNGWWKRQRINVFNFCKPQKMELVCKFCTEVILAKKNSGYIRSFFCLQGTKTLNNLKKTFISVIYWMKVLLLSIILYIFAFKLKIFANERFKSY